MSCCDLTLTVQEEDPIKLEIVEAAIKPEQDKTVTPTYAEQTVLPDAGMVLGSVTVEPIPDPTDRMTITENGSYDVARIGTADVDVLPTLQTKTVEPKEYGQTIRADSIYDGLEQVNVLQIPEWYVVPQGSVDVTENGSYDVTEKKTVIVSVPVPVMPEEYAVGGSIADSSCTGYYIKRGAAEIKANMFQSIAPLEWVDIPDSVTSIGQGAFAYLHKMGKLRLPEHLQTIGVSCFYMSDTVEIESLPSTLKTLGGSCFYGCSKVSVAVLPPMLTEIPLNCFISTGVKVSEIPAGIVTIASGAFMNCKGITSMTFLGTPTSIANNAFNNCTNLTDIYVPWSEGEVANAPWGATNATIHYNWEG